MEFSETQTFRQKWLMALLAFTFIVAVGAPLVVAWKTGEQDVAWTSFLIGCVIILLGGLVLMSHMETRIDYSGIRLHFKPFFWREKVWNWGDVKEAYVRTYNPIMEYGGWGIRYTFTNGRAYNIRGKKGLQLKLENGKKILIGTQKPEELEKLLQYLRSHHKLNIGQAHD